ncbi:hypothetical protein E2C01_044463 [Portunus trituberculatus]|uniref:Uncharacterized protein n=1 Tax=Portunus trituberculatus TaxID=210409 RepID=A0A5B7G2F2_PORTR|nr:hypothetical protein [Portunus trituberculatus]
MHLIPWQAKDTVRRQVLQRSDAVLPPGCPEVCGEAVHPGLWDTRPLRHVGRHSFSPEAQTKVFICRPALRGGAAAVECARPADHLPRLIQTCRLSTKSNQPLQVFK